MSNQKFKAVLSDADLADELGSLKAEIKALQDQAKLVEGILKAKRLTVVEGSLFRVAISYGIESTRTNWQAVAKHFKPSRQLITGNSKVITSDRVTVSSHKK